MNNGRKIFLLAFSIFFLLCGYMRIAEAQQKWSITAYGALLSIAPIEKALVNFDDIEESYQFVALALGRGIGSYKKIHFEMEGQIVKHLGDQHHMEFNAAIIARLLNFPWENTSLAVGEGLSMASRKPKFEKEIHEGKASALLNYLMFEFAFSLPDAPRWKVIARLHHRSGVNGLFNDISGGSNALGMGIRYKF
ncbi:MAG: hypothetical protein ACMUIM_00440 [bacterium]